jgi:hypothetical protein
VNEEAIVFRRSSVGLGLWIGSGTIHRGSWNPLVERAMRAGVIVSDVLSQHLLEMITTPR